MSKLNRLSDILERYKSDFAKADMVAGKKGGNWKKYATAEFGQLVDNLSKALIHRGLKKGDRVALMSGNRPEWNFVDFACNQIGIAIVPLYPTLAAHDFVHIIRDSEVRLAFVSNKDWKEKMDEAQQNSQAELEVYTLDNIAGGNYWEDLYDLGKQQDIELQPHNDGVQEDDLLTLIYTSGTSGKPKGVYLTHK